MTTLDIAVYAFTGPDFKSGLAFKFFPLDPNAVTAKYLDDTAGNLTIPQGGKVEIHFYLKTALVSWPDKPNVGLSFSTGSTGQDTLKIWDPTTPGAPLPAAFDKPTVASDGSVKYMQVYTTATPNGKTYSYSLTVGATAGGQLNAITVDPRIRNGGDNLSVHYVVAVATGFVLGIAAYAAWKFFNRSKPGRG